MFKPFLHIKTRTGLCRQLVMADNFDAWEAAVEIEDIGLHSLKLCRCTGILGRFSVPGTAAGIDDVSADGVIALSSIGHLPRVDMRVLIIVDKSLHRTIQVDDVCVAHLSPTSPALRQGGGVPPADVGSSDLSPLWCSGTVYYEILELGHDVDD